MTQKKKHIYSLNFIDVAIVLLILTAALVVLYFTALSSNEDVPEVATRIEYTFTINDVDIRLLPLIQLGHEVFCYQTGAALGSISSIVQIPIQVRATTDEEGNPVYRNNPRYMNVELTISAYALLTPHGFIVEEFRLNVMSEFALNTVNFFSVGRVSAIAEVE